MAKKAFHTKDNIGQIWYCYYWQTSYKILKVTDAAIEAYIIAVQWQDGHTTQHCTPYDLKNDYRIS